MWNTLRVVMNPKDPQKSSSLTLSPYPVRVSGNGFRAFDTERGITYQLVFALEEKSYPNSPFAKNLVTFTISPLRGYTYDGFYKDRGDPRIELTIMGQLQSLFDLNPLLVVAYTCDTTYGLERHRSILFGKWYRKYLKFMGVTRMIYDNPGTRTYAGILYHESNPFITEIEEEFRFQLLGK